VTAISNGGMGSLRQAILDANAGYSSVIEFNIPVGSVHTIHLTSSLPDIIKPTSSSPARNCCGPTAGKTNGAKGT
jgi:hypothetical protein